MELENLQHQLGNIYYIVLYECVERENGLGCHNETQLLFLIKLQQIKQRDIEKKKGEEAHFVFVYFSLVLQLPHRKCCGNISFIYLL